jgi:hypothetical protein
MRTTPNKLEAELVDTNSLVDPQSRMASSGKLAEGSPQLNLFEPHMWSIIQKER